VLLVDDQVLVGMAIKRLLTGEADIEIHCCHAADQAVAAALRVQPTVILQDLVMPGIDGLSLLASYRSQAITAQTPVIVLSGNDSAEMRAKAKAAGAQDYLVKLPPRKDLIACIRQHGSAVARPSGAVGPAAPPGSGTVSTFDPSVISDLEDVSPDFVSDLVETFVKDAVVRIDGMRGAISHRDHDALRISAHSLKGSALTMGGMRLADLCGRLEAHAKDTGDFDTAADAITAIGTEMNALSKALAAHTTRVQPRDLPDRGAA
jgi:CheY-like chemotaxis protein